MGNEPQERPRAETLDELQDLLSYMVGQEAILLLSRAINTPNDLFMLSVQYPDGVINQEVTLGGWTDSNVLVSDILAALDRIQTWSLGDKLRKQIQESYQVILERTKN